MILIKILVFHKSFLNIRTFLNIRMLQTTRKHMRIFRRHLLSMTLLSYYGYKRMIVLNILSFGRYLLLKRFWSRTLLVLQLHCERIVCLLKLTISQLFYISFLLDHVLSIMHFTFIFVKYEILMDMKIFKT